MLNGLFDYLSDNADAYNLICTILGIIISYKVFRNSRKSMFIKEKLLLVVSPLFEIIEKYLKVAPPELSQEDMMKIQSIIHDNSIYAGGKYRPFLRISLASETERKRQFAVLCALVDRDYDKLCKAAGITRRSAEYRLSMYNLRHNTFTVIRFVALCLLQLFLMLIVVLAIAQLLKYLLPYATQFIAQHRSVSLLILLPTFVAIIAYQTKY